MVSSHPFPLGLASKEAFCNRKHEIEALLDNIQTGKHTLLIATRRYGKSSLALQVLKKSKLPYIDVDFYMASHERAIENYILTSVVDLMGAALGPVEKWMQSLKRYVKTLKPKIDLGATPFKLELTTQAQEDPANNVKEALLLLERLLEEKKQRAVLLFDEFQAVGVIAQGKGIEAAIRHVAQKTHYLSIIFSGSNRKLLQTMFEDELRPLYKLCWKLSLKRIDAKHYADHIQKIAQKTWKQSLTTAALTCILENSERHPYYLNKLCSTLWSTHPHKPPSALDVDAAWLSIVQQEKSDAIKDIMTLSLGQKNVLSHLAKKGGHGLMSKENILSLQMSSSSIATALTGLEEKDIIEKIDTTYIIVNPVIKFYSALH